MFIYHSLGNHALVDTCYVELFNLRVKVLIIELYFNNKSKNKNIIIVINEYLNKWLELYMRPYKKASLKIKLEKNQCGF